MGREEFLVAPDSDTLRYAITYMYRTDKGGPASFPLNSGGLPHKMCPDLALRLSNIRLSIISAGHISLHVDLGRTDQ